MGRHDLTNKNTMTKTMTNTRTKTMTNTFREDLQRVIVLVTFETFDQSDEGT